MPRSSFRDLRAILTADLRAQELKASRITALHLLALAGGLCWILASWPTLLPRALRLVALLGWPLGLALLVLLGILEWRWESRLIRLTKR